MRYLYTVTVHGRDGIKASALVWNMGLLGSYERATNFVLLIPFGVLGISTGKYVFSIVGAFFCHFPCSNAQSQKHSFSLVTLTRIPTI
jgi:hypothetical protein